MDDEKDTAGAVVIIPLPPEGRARPLRAQNRFRRRAIELTKFNPANEA
jgi:hypothetical protein